MGYKTWVVIIATVYIYIYKRKKEIIATVKDDIYIFFLVLTVCLFNGKQSGGLLQEGGRGGAPRRGGIQQVRDLLVESEEGLVGGGGDVPGGHLGRPQQLLLCG
jgi:hypothetical protein